MDGIVYLLASLSLSPTPSDQSTIDHAVATAVRELQSASEAIQCDHDPALAVYACLQMSEHDRERFSGLDVRVRPARKALRAGTVVVDSTVMGPGGASTRFIGQTADHRYDIVVSEMGKSGPGDDFRLPTAETLIARIALLYAKER